MTAETASSHGWNELWPLSTPPSDAINGIVEMIVVVRMNATCSSRYSPW